VLYQSKPYLLFPFMSWENLLHGSDIKVNKERNLRFQSLNAVYIYMDYWDQIKERLY
jgi:hypothetical protein